MRILHILIAATVLWASALAYAVCAQAPAAPTGAATTAKEKEETCRISGMVTKLADGAPLKGATVRLENPEDREHVIATRSNADGRFELNNVPAGRYKLRVSRNGYVEQEYGQRKPSDPGSSFTLSPGQVKTGITFRLTPSAVISGRVFNEDGEPEPEASVVAWRETYKDGRKSMTQFKQVATDDLGAFRIYGLSPGRYFVSAMGAQWNRVVGDREFAAASASASIEQGYTRTYYPGTADLSRATAINVKEGDEVPGADIALKQVAVHRVRGRVLNPLSQKPGQDVGVLIVSRSKLSEWDLARDARAKTDGSFEVANVAPGAYTLVAFSFNEGLPTMQFGTQRVDVGESDIEGVAVLIGPGATIQGRVQLDGKASQDQELLITANSVESEILPTSRSRLESGQFTLKDLVEGDYRIAVSGASRDTYVKQVTFGQTFASDDDIISVAKGANPALEITISSHGARVQGSVVDKDGLPAAGVWVVAVPDQAHRTVLRLFKSQTTDQYGKFDLHGLAPGEYKLFAWDGAEEHAWEDPDFLKPFEQDGSKMEVRDDDAATLNLTVIAMKREGGD